MNVVIDSSLSSMSKSEWFWDFSLNLSTRILYHISWKKSTDFNGFLKYFLKNFSSQPTILLAAARVRYYNRPWLTKCRLI